MADGTSEAKRIGLTNDRAKNLKILDRLSSDLQWSVNNLRVLTTELSELDSDELNDRYGFTPDDIAVMRKHQQENLAIAQKKYPGHFGGSFLQPTKEIASKIKSEKKAVMARQQKPIAALNKELQTRGVIGDVGAFLGGVGKGYIADNRAAAYIRHGLDPTPIYSELGLEDPYVQSGASFGKGYKENFLPTMFSLVGLTAGAGAGSGLVGKAGSLMGVSPASPLLNLTKAGVGFTTGLVGAHQTSAIGSRLLPQLPEDVQALSNQTFAGPERQLGNVAAMMPFFTPLHVPDVGRPTVFGGLGARRMIGRVAEEGIPSIGSPQSIETVTDIAGRTYFYQNTNNEIDKNNKQIEQKWFEITGERGTPEDWKTVGWVDNAERMQRLASAVGFGGMTGVGKFISGPGAFKAVQERIAARNAREIVAKVQGEPAKPTAQVAPEQKGKLAPDNNLVFDFDVSESRAGQKFRVPHRLAAIIGKDATPESASVLRLDKPQEGIVRIPDSISIGLSDRLQKAKPVVADITGTPRESTIVGFNKDGDFFVSQKQEDGTSVIIPRTFKQLPAELQEVVRNEARQVAIPGENESRRVVLNPDKLAGESEQYRPMYDMLDMFGKEFPYKVDMAGKRVSAAVTKIDGSKYHVELPSGNKFVVSKESIILPDGMAEIKVSLPKRAVRTLVESKSNKKAVGTKIEGSDFEMWVPSEMREGFQPSRENTASLFEGATPERINELMDSENGPFKPGTIIQLGIIDGRNQYGVVVRPESFDINGEEKAAILVKSITDPKLEPFVFNPENTGDDILTLGETIESNAGDGKGAGDKGGAGERVVVRRRPVQIPRKRKTSGKGAPPEDAEEAQRLADLNTRISSKKLLQELIDEHNNIKDEKNPKAFFDALQKAIVTKAKELIANTFNNAPDLVLDGEIDYANKAIAGELAKEWPWLGKFFEAYKKDLENIKNRNKPPSDVKLKVAGTKQPEEYEFPYGERFGGTKEKPVIAEDADLPEQMRSEQRGVNRYRPMTQGEEVSRIGSIKNIPKQFMAALKRIKTKPFKFQDMDVALEGVANKEEFKARLVKVFEESPEQAEALANYVDRWAVGWASEIARLSGYNTKRKYVARRTVKDPAATPRKDKEGKVLPSDEYKLRYREQQIPRTEEENLKLLKQLTTYFYTDRLGTIAKLPLDQVKHVKSTGFTIGFYGDKSRVVNVAFALSGKENFVTQVHEVNHLLVRSLYGPMYHELVSRMIPSYLQQHTTDKTGIIPEFFEEQVVSGLTRALFMADKNKPILNEAFGEGGAEFDPALNRMFSDMGDLLRSASEEASKFKQDDLRSRQNLKEYGGWLVRFDQRPDWHKQDIPAGTPFLVKTSSGVFDRVLANKHQATEELPQTLRLIGSSQEAQDIPIKNIIGFGQTKATIGKTGDVPLNAGAQRILARWMGHWAEHTNEIMKRVSIAKVTDLQFEPESAVSIQRRTIGYKWWKGIDDYKRVKPEALSEDWSENRIRQRTYESYLGWLDYGGPDRQGYEAFRPFDEIMQLELEGILKGNIAKNNPPPPKPSGGGTRPPRGGRKPAGAGAKPPETKPPAPDAAEIKRQAEAGAAAAKAAIEAAKAGPAGASGEGAGGTESVSPIKNINLAGELDLSLYSPTGESDKPANRKRTPKKEVVPEPEAAPKAEEIAKPEDTTEVDNAVPDDEEGEPEDIHADSLKLIKFAFNEISGLTQMEYSAKPKNGKVRYESIVDRMMTLPIIWAISGRKYKDQFNGTEYGAYKLISPYGRPYPSGREVRAAFQSGIQSFVRNKNINETRQDFTQDAYLFVSGELNQLLRDIRPEGDGSVSITVVTPEGFSVREIITNRQFEKEVLNAVRRGAYKASVNSRMDVMGPNKNPNLNTTVAREYETTVQNRDLVFMEHAQDQADRVMSESRNASKLNRNQIVQSIYEKDLVDRLASRMAIMRWARFFTPKWITVDELTAAHGISPDKLDSIKDQLRNITGADAISQLLKNPEFRSIPAVLHQASISFLSDTGSINKTTSDSVYRTTSVKITSKGLEFADITVDDIKQNYIVDQVQKTIDMARGKQVVTNVINFASAFQAEGAMETALGFTGKDFFSEEAMSRSSEMTRALQSRTAVDLINNNGYERSYKSSVLNHLAPKIERQMNLDPRTIDTEIKKANIRIKAIQKHQQEGGFDLPRSKQLEYANSILEENAYIETLKKARKKVNSAIDSQIGSVVKDARVFVSSEEGQMPQVFDDIDHILSLSSDFNNSLSTFLNKLDAGSPLSKAIKKWVAAINAEDKTVDRDVLIKRMEQAFKFISNANQQAVQMHGDSIYSQQRTPRYVEFSKGLTLREYALAEMQLAERSFTGEKPKRWPQVVKLMSGAQTAKDSLRTKMNAYEMDAIGSAQDPVTRDVVDYLRRFVHGKKAEGQSSNDYASTLSDYAKIVAGEDATHGQAMYMVLQSAMEGFMPDGIYGDKRRQFQDLQRMLRSDLRLKIGHLDTRALKNIQDWIGNNTLIPTSWQFNKSRSGEFYTEVLGFEHGGIDNTPIVNDSHFIETFAFGIPETKRYATVLKSVNQALLDAGLPERKILSDQELSFLVGFGGSNEYTEIQKMNTFRRLSSQRDDAILNPLKTDAGDKSSGEGAQWYSQKSELLEKVSLADLNAAMEQVGFSSQDKMAAMATGLRAFARDGGKEIIDFSVANKRFPSFDELPDIADATGADIKKLQQQWQNANFVQQIAGVDALTKGVVGTNIKLRSLADDTFEQVTTGISFNIDQADLTLLDGMVRNSVIDQVSVLSDERILNAIVDARTSYDYNPQSVVKAVKADAVKDMLFATGTYTGRIAKNVPVPGKRFAGDGSDAKFAKHVKTSGMSAIQTAFDLVADFSGTNLESVNPIFAGESGTTIAKQFASLQKDEVATPVQKNMVEFANALVDTIIASDAGIVDSINSHEYPFYTYKIDGSTRIVDVYLPDGTQGYKIDYKNARVIEYAPQVSVSPENGQRKYSTKYRYVTATSEGPWVDSINDLDGTEPLNPAEQALFKLITTDMPASELKENGSLIRDAIVKSPKIRTVHPVYWHARQYMETFVHDPMWNAKPKTDAMDVMSTVGVFSPEDHENYVKPVIDSWILNERVVLDGDSAMPYYDGSGYSVKDENGNYSSVFARLIAHGLTSDKALQIYAMTESPSFRLFVEGDMIESVKMTAPGGLHDKTYVGRVKIANDYKMIDLLNRKYDMVVAAGEWIDNPTKSNLEKFKFLYDEVYPVDSNGAPTSEQAIDKKFKGMTVDQAQAIVDAANSEIESGGHSKYTKPYKAYKDSERPIQTGKPFTTLAFEDGRRLSYADTGQFAGSYDLGSGLSKSTIRSRKPVWVKFSNPYVHDVQNGNISTDVFQDANNAAASGNHDGIVFLNVRDSIQSPLSKNLAYVVSDSNVMSIPEMAMSPAPRTELPKIVPIGDVTPLYLSTLKGDVIEAPVTTKNIPEYIEADLLESRGLNLKERAGGLGLRILDEVMSIARFPLSLDIAFTTIQGGTAATGVFTDPRNTKGRRGDTMIALKAFLGSLRGMAPNMQITIAGKKFGIDKIGRRQWISVYNEIRKDPYFEIMRRLNVPLHFVNFEKRIEAERKRRFQQGGGDIPYEDIVINMMDVDERGNMTDYYENRTFMGSLPLVGMFERQMSLQHDLLLFMLVKKQLQENPAFKVLADFSNPTAVEDIGSNYDARKMVDFLSMTLGDFQYTSNEVLDARYGRLGKIFSAAPRWYLSNVFLQPQINAWATKMYKTDPRWQKLLGPNWRGADIYRHKNPELIKYQGNTYWGAVMFWVVQQLAAEIYGKVFGREDITGMPAKVGSYRVGNWRVAESTGKLEPANFMLQQYNSIMKGQYREKPEAGKTLDETNMRFVSDSLGRLGYKTSPLITKAISLYTGRDVIGRAVYSEDADAVIAADDFYTDILAPVAETIGIEIPKERNKIIPFTSVLLTGNMPASWQDFYQTYAEARWWNPGNRAVAFQIATQQFLLSALGTQIKYDPFVPQRYQGKYRQMHLYKRLQDTGPTGTELMQMDSRTRINRILYGRD